MWSLGLTGTRAVWVLPAAVLTRIKSTTGINKITKTMKMVAASKMKGDEQRLKDGRPFQVGGGGRRGMWRSSEGGAEPCMSP